MPSPYDLSSGNAGVRAMLDHNRRVILNHAEFLRAEARAYESMSEQAQARVTLAKRLDKRASAE